MLRLKTVRLPPRSLNAHAERFVRPIKHERLNRIVPIGERNVRDVIDVHLDHYNRERHHQGPGDDLLGGCIQHPPPTRAK